MLWRPLINLELDHLFLVECSADSDGSEYADQSRQVGWSSGQEAEHAGVDC